jgi:riboflavin synthase
MFTGSDRRRRPAGAREMRGGDARLRIDVGTLPFDDVQLGESIASTARA